METSGKSFLENEEKGKNKGSLHHTKLLDTVPIYLCSIDKCNVPLFFPFPCFEPSLLITHCSFLLGHPYIPFIYFSTCKNPIARGKFTRRDLGHSQYLAGFSIHNNLCYTTIGHEGEPMLLSEVLQSNAMV